eukprot:gene2123-5164_t
MRWWENLDQVRIQQIVEFDTTSTWLQTTATFCDTSIFTPYLYTQGIQDDGYVNSTSGFHLDSTSDLLPTYFRPSTNPHPTKNEQ